MALTACLAALQAFACGGGGSAAPDALHIVTDRLPSAKVGVRYGETVEVRGGRTPHVFDVAGGQLPDGLDLSAAFGRLSGTPTAAGRFEFTLGVTSFDAQRVTRDFAVTVAPGDEPLLPLVIEQEVLPAGAVGVRYETALSVVEGAPPFVWSASNPSALPPGLTLDLQTGRLHGVPAAGGGYAFVVVVVDQDRREGSATLSVHIDSAPPLIVLTTALPRAFRDAPYEVPLQAEGGVPPLRWTLQGTPLPEGLTLTREGLIAGTPVVVGVFDVTFVVTDSAPVAARASVTLGLTVRPPILGLTVHTAALPEGFAGQPYRVEIEARGGVRPYVWALTAGVLPDGLAWDAAGGVIEGTPTLSAVGAHPLSFEVTDAGDVDRPAQHATADFTLIVYGEPARPRLVAAIAEDASRAGDGVQPGDRLTLHFDRATDSPEIPAVRAADFLEVVDKDLGGFTATWGATRVADDTLVLEFDGAGGIVPTVAPGDLVTFPVGGIRDRSGTLGVVGSPPRVQGSFSWSIPLDGTFGVRLRVRPAPGVARGFGVGPQHRGVAVGDLTGDGLPDLVIVHGVADRGGIGRAVVVAGDGGLPLGDVDLGDPATTYAVIEGGVDAVVVGDLDGDGLDDLVLGESALGRVHVVPGGGGFPSGAVDTGALGPAATALVGSSSSGFGAGLWLLHATGGALPDLLVAAPYTAHSGQRGAGSLYVFAGGPGGVGDRTIDDGAASGFEARLDGVASSPSGAVFSVAEGRLFADDAVDLVIGYPQGHPSPDVNAPLAGRVMVLRGGLGARRGVIALAEPGAVDATFYVGQDGARFGHRVLVADVAGDAHDDLVIAAPGHDVQGRRAAGAVFVIAGGVALPRDGAVVDVSQGGFDARIVGAATEAGAGADLTIGDTNRDGLRDLVIGADHEGERVGGDDPRGRIYVLYGRAEGLAPSVNLAAAREVDLRYEGDTTTDAMGRPVGAGLGASVLSADVDGDRVPDLVVAAPAPDGAGVVYVLGIFRDEGPVIVGARAESGRRLVLRFDKPANLFAVTSANVHEVLVIGGGAKTAGGVVAATWSTSVASNDTLTLELDGTGTLVPGDRVTIGAGTIRDEIGHLDAVGGAVIVGAF